MSEEKVDIGNTPTPPHATKPKKKKTTKPRSATAQIMMDQQRDMYQQSLREHKRNSLITIGILAVAFIVSAVFLVRCNTTHKANIEAIVSEYEAEKQAIINTAFNIKDSLIGEYYIDDKKQFEDFMLAGGKVITQQYDSYSDAIKSRKFHAMNKDEMKAYLELNFAGAKLVGIDPYLLLAMDFIESSYNKHAVSPVGARGVCQFMPFTAKMMANAHTNYNMLQVDSYDIRKLFDPVYSKKLQIRFVKALFDEYNGRVEWVLTAYNWGPGKTTALWWQNGEAVFKNLNPEQQKYATDVLRVYNGFKNTPIINE